MPSLESSIAHRPRTNWGTLLTEHPEYEDEIRAALAGECSESIPEQKNGYATTEVFIKEVGDIARLIAAKKKGAEIVNVTNSLSGRIAGILRNGVSTAEAQSLIALFRTATSTVETMDADMASEIITKASSKLQKLMRQATKKERTGDLAGEFHDITINVFPTYSAV